MRRAVLALGARQRDALGAIVAIGTVLAVTLWALHPSLLLATTLTAGGDTGAHVALPWFLRTELLPHGQLTGWYPRWFDGFPLYTYYFVLADLICALASYVIPYTVAFKLTTILGSLLLPACAYAMGRCFRLRAPIPACLAAATLPFLFETSFTISGGNLFSTLAGEYAFSLALALALLAIGLFARGMRSGRGVVAAAVVLAATLAAHALPWAWALVGIAILAVIDAVPSRLAPRDPVPAPAAAGWRTAGSFLARAGALSLALSAWWLLPWVTGQAYTISMGYVNDGQPGQPSYASHLFPSGDRVMLGVALVGLGVAWAQRSRFGVWLTTLTVLAAVAYVADPQGSLWDQRLLPFWFLGGWLVCGWLAGVLCTWVAARARQHAEERWIADVHAGLRRRGARAALPTGWPAALSGAVVVALVAAVVVLPPMTSVVPRSFLTSLGITPSANEVPNWSAYNYSGYQGVRGWSTFAKDWPEYRAVVAMMARAGRTHGCGQSMWEYDPAETDFGTTESLMLLPYWTDNCIGSMEGLLFESSATTPYHFLNQSELSVTPSDPMVGLPYGPSGSPNVVLGLRHLQLLGVRYFLAFTPSIVRQALRSRLVVPIASTGPWRYQGHARTWHLFIVRDAPLAIGLTHVPNVITTLGHKGSWLSATVAWWLDPSRWGVYLAQGGPASWPRRAFPAHVVARPLKPVVVSDAVATVDRVRFRVDRLGVPVVVRVSYFPRWHASGASGPWRVSPNLMVVVPTQHTVTLTYEGSTATTVGSLVTLLGIAIAVGCLAVAWRRRAVARRSPR